MNFNNLIQVDVGIRYQINNVIEDKMGEIADSVLFSKRTPFGPDFFSKTQTRDNIKILYDEDDRNHFIIKNTDLIFKNSTTRNKVDLQKFHNDFRKYIFQNIIIDREFKRIDRYGIVYTFKIEKEKHYKRIIHQFLTEFSENLNLIDLRFSQKLLTIKTVSNPKKTNDYINIIYNLKKMPNEDFLYISVDYQIIFLPQLELASQYKIENFFQKSIAFIENKVFQKFNAICEIK